MEDRRRDADLEVRLAQANGALRDLRRHGAGGYGVLRPLAKDVRLIKKFS